ncbi:hypothetical protein N3K66_000837 [Trichothecium roseum]|uniref:Uncharacterized protein n=1 Tax=Trichothecium roseum TaxID=47278 RepID=A0ACC0VEW8_9HYPO|nr:hypothetical protein N3K66_000837 [Trichothecium roseum]
MAGKADKTILVVGAGVFGLTTALELKTRGYGSVTVLDRAPPPVPGGSSVDVSRVIRAEYADAAYHQLAEEALAGWSGEYAAHYRQSGLVMVAAPGDSAYLDGAKEVARAAGTPFREWDDAERIKEEMPGVEADLRGLKGYYNARGGWADAGAAMRQLAETCGRAGVSFVTGPRGTVTALRRRGGRVTGVEVAEGPPLEADAVVLATGAWTNRLLPLTHATSASGQPVGFVQLAAEEARRLRDMPVVINLSTGVFVFPPHPGSGLLKVARHGYGWANNVEVETGGGDGSSARIVSAPKMDVGEGGWLPDDADGALRDGLRQLAPGFADRAWAAGSRLCWYSDTPEGDFVVDWHPDEEGLFLATGGAGHAFKFLPVLGRHIADCFEGKASAELRHKWRLRKAESEEGGGLKTGDGSRGGPPIRALTKEEQAKL